jgi:putative ABC transport system substrate-binding protein
MIAARLLVLVALLAAALAAEAQPTSTVPRIGYLSVASAGAPGHVAIRQSFRELGYVEGQSILFEDRFAEGQSARLPALAAELARLNVDVIVAASPPAIQAAKDATRTIPIVMITGGDPVRSGFVVGLARPGGNITGVMLLQSELAGKQMELLKQVVPSLRNAAILWDPAMPTTTADLTDVRNAARSLGLRLQIVEARSATDYAGAFAAMAKERAAAVVVIGSPTFLADQRRIADLAAKHRLPATYSFKEQAEIGGLMSYGTSQADVVRRAASYVDKILKGAKPGDLPVEQPTTFELVINLKTAKALGLTIPQSLLLRADRVIE